MKNRSVLSAMVLLGCLICVQSLFADALDNWHWRNPLPNGNPQAGPHTLYSVVFASGKFVGVGDSGTVSISPDGTNWTESATATTNSLNAIVYSGGLFVAAGDGGSVETSADGTNWVLQATGTTNSLNAAAYGNGRFVAVGVNGVVIASSDSVNWSAGMSGTSNTLVSVTYGSAGFMTVCPVTQNTSQTTSGGTDQFFSSLDGVVWASHTLTVGNLYSNLNGSVVYFMHHDIVTFADGLYMIGSHVYVNSTTIKPYIFTSADGNNWATNGFPYAGDPVDGFSFQCFMSGNGVVMAVGGEPYGAFYPLTYTSPDGGNWTNNTVTLTNVVRAVYGGTYGLGTFVVVSSPYYQTSLPLIFTVPPTNLLAWTNQQHPPTPPTGPTGNFTSITSSNSVYVVATSSSFVCSTNGLVYTVVSNSPSLAAVTYTGSSFIGVGSGGNIYQSGDGQSWVQRNSATLNNLRGVTTGSGLIVAVGDNGAIQTSPTGTIWTSRTSGTSLTLYGVAYANGLYVAVGYLGTVLTSPDGVSWTGQDSGQLTNLLSVAYGSAGFAVAGPGGTILTSPDGINWTRQNSGTIASLESIAYGNGYYLATGDGVVALSSPDGITWTPRNTGATGGQNFYGSAFLNSRFDVVGSAGTILESDLVNPLFDVQIHPGGNHLTAFVPPGSNFRIQTCTNLAASIWIDAASFNNASAITQWTNTSSGFNQLFYRAVAP
jgi:hypothetical protein